MKKRFFSLMVILFVAISSFSQVQNKFFGATLGVSDMNSTYSSMYNYFNEKPNATNLFEVVISVFDKYFAGYKWDCINTYYHNDKFAQLGLRFMGNYQASSQRILSVYNSLQKALADKYGRTLKMNQVQEGGVKAIYYFDGRYLVSLELNWHLNSKKVKEYYEVDLWYSDKKLLSEPIRPKINDEL